MAAVAWGLELQHYEHHGSGLQQHEHQGLGLQQLLA
jgi:hypothetical protein